MPAIPVVARSSRANTLNGMSVVCDSQYVREYRHATTRRVRDGLANKTALTDSRWPDDGDDAARTADGLVKQTSDGVELPSAADQ